MSFDNLSPYVKYLISTREWMRKEKPKEKHQFSVSRFILSFSRHQFFVARIHWIKKKEKKQEIPSSTFLSFISILPFIRWNRLAHTRSYGSICIMYSTGCFQLLTQPRFLLFYLWLSVSRNISSTIFQLVRHLCSSWRSLLWRRQNSGHLHMRETSEANSFMKRNEAYSYTRVIYLHFFFSAVLLSCLSDCEATSVCCALSSPFSFRVKSRMNFRAFMWLIASFWWHNFICFDTFRFASTKKCIVAWTVGSQNGIQNLNTICYYCSHDGNRRCYSL